MDELIKTNGMIDLAKSYAAGCELPDIKNFIGERWFPLETTIEEDMAGGNYWGMTTGPVTGQHFAYGCCSEWSRLRSVLLHRPGNEVAEGFDYNAARFRAPVDPDLFRAQHDNLAQYFRDHDIEVVYTVGGRDDKPNQIFCRDKLFMTPEGAIIARLSIESKRGEERFIAETCAKAGIPIVRTIVGGGIFESACAEWVDRKTVILGTSTRANREGYDQMEYELKRMGVENIIPMQISYGHAHLDGLINFPSEDICVIHPNQVPYDVVMTLKGMGYHILEAPSLTEVKYGFAVNFVAIDNGHIVTGNKSPKMAEELEKLGVTVDQLDLTEIQKGHGSVHCCTAFLSRDFVK